jgi:hypothetical protein
MWPETKSKDQWVYIPLVYSVVTHVKLATPDSMADFMASDNMYSEVPFGASGNCNDHLICSPC